MSAPDPIIVDHFEELWCTVYPLMESEAEAQAFAKDFLERYAHELAEEIRARANEVRAADWGKSRGKRAYLTGMEVARKLIDPEVSGGV